MSARAVAVFRAHLPEGIEVAGDLTGPLQRLLDEARSAWPDLPLTEAEFVAHLAARLPGDLTANAALDQVRGADLFLACACARREPRAIEAFDAAFGPVVESAARKFRLRDALPDDAIQIIREKILVEGAGGVPAIARYSGRGALQNWVRATAVRALIDASRRAKRGAIEVTVADDVLLRLPAGAEDPRLDHLKRLYRHEFKQAFESAIASLTARRRNLLRQHFVYGLTTEQIGSVYRVHRATAARWLLAAREQLVAATRNDLGDRLGVGREDVDSIMRLIESQVEVSMSRLLASVSSARE